MAISNVSRKFQSQIKLNLNRELRSHHVNNSRQPLKTPELVDKVVFETVDSSSFDNFVSGMDNGKNRVTQGFINSLMQFANVIAQGITQGQPNLPNDDGNTLNNGGEGHSVYTGQGGNVPTGTATEGTFNPGKQNGLQSDDSYERLKK